MHAQALAGLEPFSLDRLHIVIPCSLHNLQSTLQVHMWLMTPGEHRINRLEHALLAGGGTNVGTLYTQLPLCWPWVALLLFYLSPSCWKTPGSPVRLAHRSLAWNEPGKIDARAIPAGKQTA